MRSFPFPPFLSPYSVFFFFCLFFFVLLATRLQTSEDKQNVTANSLLLSPKSRSENVVLIVRKERRTLRCSIFVLHGYEGLLGQDHASVHTSPNSITPKQALESGTCNDYHVRNFILYSRNRNRNKRCLGSYPLAVVLSRCWREQSLDRRSHYMPDQNGQLRAH